MGKEWGHLPEFARATFGLEDDTMNVDVTQEVLQNIRLRFRSSSTGSLERDEENNNNAQAQAQEVGAAIKVVQNPPRIEYAMNDRPLTGDPYPGILKELVLYFVDGTVLRYADYEHVNVAVRVDCNYWTT